jgi:hypothetical protein
LAAQWRGPSFVHDDGESIDAQRIEERSHPTRRVHRPSKTMFTSLFFQAFPKVRKELSEYFTVPDPAIDWGST